MANLTNPEAEAKKRQGARTDIKEIIPESSEHGQARDKAAELVGVNPRYISDANKNPAPALTPMRG